MRIGISYLTVSLNVCNQSAKMDWYFLAFWLLYLVVVVIAFLQFVLF